MSQYGKQSSAIKLRKLCWKASSNGDYWVFFTLFEINNIDISNLYPIDASKALRWGTPFTYFGLENLKGDPFKRLGVGFSRTGNFEVDKYSEISSLALLFSLGAKEAVEIGRTSKRTHDFDVGFGGDLIEVEVTRPAGKQAHVLRVEQATSIGEFAFSLQKKNDISIYLPDLIDASDTTSLKDKIKAINEECKIDKSGKWAIVSKAPNRGVYDVFENIEDAHKPLWWPRNVVNGFQIRQWLAGPDCTAPPPRITIRYACPFKGYINQAKKKATRFQGTRRKPYLLMIDANSLPDSYQEFERNFDIYFKKWNHITAVLIYEDHWGLEDVGWMFQIFKNPYCLRDFDEKTKKFIERFSTRTVSARRYV